MVVYNNVLAGAAGSGGAGYEIERSLRFNSADSAYLSKTFSSAGDRQKWTFSAWIKFAKTVGNNGIFECPYPGSGGTISDTFEVWYSGGQIYITDYSVYYFISDARLRDPGAWGHLVIRVDTTLTAQADRIRLYWNGEQLVNTATSYPSQNANLAVNNNANHQIGNWRGSTYSDLYYAEIHHVDGQSLDPTSFGEFDADTGVWNPIEYSGTYGTNGFYLDFSDNSSNAALGTDSSGNSNDWTANNLEHRIDTTVWTSYLFASGSTYDGTSTTVNFQGPNNGTAQAFDGSTSTQCIANVSGASYIYFRPPGGFSNPSKIRIYASNVGEFRINGSVVTTSPAAGSSAQWYEVTSTLPSTVTEIAHNGESSTYNARVRAYEIDDQVLTVVGENTDVLLDSPTNYEADSGNNGGNYCTWNPLVVTTNNSLSNGNLEASHTASTGWSGGLYTGYAMFVGNMGVTSGKYYWEGSFTSSSTGAVGVVNNPNGHLYYVGYADTNAKSVGFSSTYAYNNGFGSAVGSLPAISQGDIIGVAIDMDNGKLYFSVNGTYVNSGDPVAGTGNVASGLNGETIFPAVSHIASANDGYSFTANFGARPFTYTPPTGFKSLCTQNLDDPTIADGSEYFQTSLYTGNGSSQSVTTTGMSPDLVWIKARTSGNSYPALFDTVRGTSQFLASSANLAESDHTPNGVSAFNADGFTVTDDSTGGYNVNGPAGGNYSGSGGTYVAWAWDAGDSNTSISVGGLNSAVYNQDERWSDNAFAVPSSATAGLTNLPLAFNGYLDNNNLSSFTGEVVFPEIQFASGVTEVIVYAYYSGSTDWWVKLNQNGTQYNLYQQTIVHAVGQVPGGGAYIAAVKLNLNETSITRFSFHGAGNHWFAGVRVNGKLLVNDNRTPPNVPTIASTCRANQTAGFSIVSYTGNNTNGATVGHGLNATPSWIIIKNRSTAYNWIVLYTDTTKKLYLDITNSTDSYSQTTRNSSIFTLENGTAVNGSGDDMIAYCFAPVKNYSQFGSYTGNGSIDGPFVYTGFRPAFVILKRTDGAAGWYMYDYKRDGYNPDNKLLYANYTNAEADNHIPDFLSNGFKIRTVGSVANGSGNSYIYMAFAENPFKTARAR